MPRKIAYKWKMSLMFIVVFSLLLTVSCTKVNEKKCQEYNNQEPCEIDKGCKWIATVIGGEFEDHTQYGCCPKEKYVPDKGEMCKQLIID